MKAYIVMMLNGFVLIILGIYGYFISASPTALISALVGIILAGLSFPVKKENSVVAHIGIIFTLLSSVIFFFVGFKRDNTLIIIMAAITLAAFIFYVFDFFIRKKERQSIKN